MKKNFLLIVLFIFFHNNYLLSEDFNPEKVDVRQSEYKLKKLKKSITEQIAKEKDVRSEKNKILLEIEDIEKKIYDIQEEINLLKPELTRVEVDFLQTQQDLNKNLDKLDNIKINIEGRLRAFQGLKTIGLFNLFFSSRTFTELFTRNIYLKYLLDHDNQLKNEFKKMAQALAKKKIDLENKKNIMESRQKELNELYKTFEQSREDKEKYWENLDEAGEEYSRMIVELKESAFQLEDIIKKYKVKDIKPPEISMPELSIKESDVFFEGSSADFEAKKGKLSLPVAGAIMIKNPVKGSRGIIIEAIIGTEIRSSTDGKVYYLGNHPGYGNLIIIDHGGGYRILVAQSSKFFVQLGQALTEGELIGFSAGGAWAKEGVYVEIQKDNKPLDAKAWFDLRGFKVK